MTKGRRREEMGQAGDAGAATQATAPETVDTGAGETQTSQAALSARSGDSIDLEVPCFVLRADCPGHLWALVAAAAELPVPEEALRAVREFELWMEAHR